MKMNTSTFSANDPAVRKHLIMKLTLLFYKTKLHESLIFIVKPCIYIKQTPSPVTLK